MEIMIIKKETQAVKTTAWVFLLSGLLDYQNDD